MPDGASVPMWGYSCGAVAGTGVNCARLSTNASGWSPVVITVPTGTTTFTINLTNNLLRRHWPTSLVIVGQLGGGQGAPGSFTATPRPHQRPAGHVADRG